MPNPRSGSQSCGRARPIRTNSCSRPIWPPGIRDAQGDSVRSSKTRKWRRGSLLRLVGALDGHWPALIRAWANTIQCRVGIATASRNEASRAARGDRRHRIKGQQLCGPLIASPSALMAFGWLPTLTTPGGPVHAAFTYNAPLFCCGLATEP